MKKAQILIGICLRTPQLEAERSAGYLFVGTMQDPKQQKRFYNQHSYRHLAGRMEAMTS